MALRVIGYEGRKPIYEDMGEARGRMTVYVTRGIHGQMAMGDPEPFKSQGMVSICARCGSKAVTRSRRKYCTTKCQRDAHRDARRSA